MKEPVVVDSTCLIGLDMIGRLDRKARDVAFRMGLKVIGTVGILIRAKRAGLIPWLKPLMNDLADKGFRLSEDLKREALLLAGE